MENRGSETVHANEWVLKQMEQISRKDYTGSYFTVATLEHKYRRAAVKVPVILNVDTYLCGDMGYEIMPVRLLAKNCPWDMNDTIVHIHTTHTNIDDNLHDIVIEDAEVHRHLVGLES